MILNKKKLNTAYSMIQAVYWALSAILFCYTTVFLQFRGYSNYEIGIIFALGNIAGFILQPLIAGHIDKTRKRALLPYMIASALLSAVLMTAVYLLPTGSVLLTAAYILLIAGNTLLQPLCTSLSFYIEGWGYPISFSRSRAVGSLCYAFITVILGMLLQKLSENSVPLSYILFSLIFAVITIPFIKRAVLFNQSKTEYTPQAAEKHGSLLGFAKENRRFLLFMLGTALIFFTHGLIGNFMIEFVRPVGGNSGDMGGVLAFMTIVEVPVMLLFSRIAKRFSSSSLLKFSAIMFTAKELMILLAQSVAGLYAAELLQALSFAVFVPASVQYVGEVIAAKDAVRGQALVTSMITLGSVFASYFGGLLLDASTPQFTLLTGVIVSAAGTIVMLFAIEKTDTCGKNIDKQ